MAIGIGPAIGIGAAFASIGYAAALPEEYAVTNITGWSAEQLSTPPSFDRYTLAGAQSLSTPTQVSPAVLPASP